MKEAVNLIIINNGIIPKESTHMQTQSTSETYQHKHYPDARGRFGTFGGKFVPESLMEPLAELEAAYNHALRDEQFQAELRAQLRSFVGRPTTLHYAPRFSQLV